MSEPNEQRPRKHLKAKATAYDYDLLNDSIFFYTEGEKYKDSLEFDGIIIDFNEDDNFLNLEMLDVSKKFHVSKSELLNIKHFGATIDIDKDNIKVSMKMEILKRNKVFDKCLEATTPNILNLPSGTQGIEATVG